MDPELVDSLAQDAATARAAIPSSDEQTELRAWMRNVAGFVNRIGHLEPQLATVFTSRELGELRDAVDWLEVRVARTHTATDRQEALRRLHQVEELLRGARRRTAPSTSAMDAASDGPPVFRIPNFVLDEASRREGGFGYVFTAREKQPPGGPNFAVKVLLPSPFLSAEKARARFTIEINALRSIQHKAIVRYVMAGVTDDQHQAPFLVMEHVDGGTLRDLRAEMTVDEKVQAIADVLDVLGTLHSKDIFHRDVKPSNVMRRKQDRQAVLVDFGLAWLAKDQYDGPPLTTGPLGTPGYVPPEVEEGDYAKSRSSRFDIYSAAVTLYELLAGRLPIAERRYRPLRDLEPDLAGLDPILEKALAPESQRFATTFELREEVSAWHRRYRARLASPRSPLLDQVRAAVLKQEAAATSAAEKEEARRRKIEQQLDEMDSWIVPAAKAACAEFVEAFHDIKPTLAFVDTERSTGQAGFDALCAVRDDLHKEAVVHFGRATPVEVRARLKASRALLRWPQREQRGRKADPRLEYRTLAGICWVLWTGKDDLRGGFGAAISHAAELQLFARPHRFPDSTEPSRINAPSEIKDYVTRALRARECPSRPVMSPSAA